MPIPRVRKSRKKVGALRPKPINPKTERTVKGGAESTKHPGTVTVPDLK
jgi:hypothetical protein